MRIDAGREIDWGRASDDYALYRPGPPDSFYAKLSAHDVGLAGQKILDLGTGTGVLAREFARRGCASAGVDVATGQIEAARRLAAREGLEAEFRVAPAEALPFEDGSFDLATANQCWLYFDLKRAIPEVRRVLRPGGRLLVSHFSYLPRSNPIARATEELVLRFNPDWSGADWDGRIPARPGWSRADFELQAMFHYDEAIPFTPEMWRGRIRALRGVGATLTSEQVRAFDAEHAALLEEVADEEFAIPHRIDVHIFGLRAESGDVC